MLSHADDNGKAYLFETGNPIGGNVDFNSFMNCVLLCVCVGFVGGILLKIIRLTALQFCELRNYCVYCRFYGRTFYDWMSFWNSVAFDILLLLNRLNCLEGLSL